MMVKWLIIFSIISLLQILQSQALLENYTCSIDRTTVIYVASRLCTTLLINRFKSEGNSISDYLSDINGMLEVINANFTKEDENIHRFEYLEPEILDIDANKIKPNYVDIVEDSLEIDKNFGLILQTAIASKVFNITSILRLLESTISSTQVQIQVHLFFLSKIVNGAIHSSIEDTKEIINKTTTRTK